MSDLLLLPHFQSLPTGVLLAADGLSFNYRASAYAYLGADNHDIFAYRDLSATSSFPYVWRLISKEPNAEYYYVQDVLQPPAGNAYVGQLSSIKTTPHGNTGYYSANLWSFTSSQYSPIESSSLDDMIDLLYDTTDIPITYYLTNCSAPSAPASVSPGGFVSFPVTVSPGYNIFNPVQGGSISVYQGDNYIPFTYENGVLSFTAPGGD